MARTAFDEVLESAHEGLEHARGRRTLRTTRLPPPPKAMGAKEVRRLRARLNASQAVFAGYLNVSAKLVQAWEAGRRSPEGAALRLLGLAEKAPELLLTLTAPTLSRPRVARNVGARSAALQQRRQGAQRFGSR
jgi:putative transcriptional regulator